MLIKRSLVAGLIALAGVAASSDLWAACTATQGLPTATGANSVTFGDGISYALPILGLDVQSSPGQINDCIVVATGSSGTPITTNLAGMDGAFATPNGTGGSPYFRTGDPLSTDPGGAGEFVGDTATTWDTRLSALAGFLGGKDMIVYFNHNQTNSGTTIDQNLFVWAQIALVDDAGILPTLYFYITSVPNGTGIQNFGAPGGDPFSYTGPQTAATNTYPTGSDASGFPTGGVGTGTGSGDASYMVSAQGHVCLNGPVGAGTPVPCSGPHVAEVNMNLGADHVANAVFFPEIQNLLNLANFGGYDALQADIRMGCDALTITGGSCSPGSVMNNGFEQIFIATASVERTCPPTDPTCVPTVPEPNSLLLAGLGLVALAGRRIRQFRSSRAI